ncbi:site-specific integrase [Sulfobacillus harzensis]|uniref:Site-specific integrase n=1 Tax=Sulfobacillus harzensis TaxID=2729629 RepID=A0A7Y0Q5H2_9FIRM|nr:site-specific integrase [Sulfobacillus harzensis]NMP25081.1 site-specific integrase [Sulfobacillus harzensis]
MNIVEPIRNPTDIQAIKAQLHATNLRDYAWFVLGINTGFRISDLLRLKVGDVRLSKSRWVDRLRVTEQKTGKQKECPLSDAIKKALGEYLATRPDCRLTDPLFPSQKGGRPLRRQAAWAILKEAAAAVGFTDPIGTHTLRKTFGYHAYRQGIDITLLQDLFNHAEPRVTLRYIGINRDQRDAVYLSLDL